MSLLLTLLPTIIGPIITALVKLLIPKIPTVLLPLTASVVGALSDQGISVLAGAAHDPMTSAAVGMAGVALREIYDQSKQAMGTPKS